MAKLSPEQRKDIASKAARAKQEFRDLVDRIHPPFGSTMPLDFGDIPST